MKHGTLNPTFYRNVVYKARKFKQNPDGLNIHLNKLILKRFRRSNIIKSLI